MEQFVLRNCFAKSSAFCFLSNQVRGLLLNIRSMFDIFNSKNPKGFSNHPDDMLDLGNNLDLKFETTLVDPNKGSQHIFRK